jgi:hypothetical protein
VRKHDVAAALAIAQDDRLAMRELLLKDPLAIDRAKHALELADRLRPLQQDD